MGLSNKWLTPLVSLAVIAGLFMVGYWVGTTNATKKYQATEIALLQQVFQNHRVLVGQVAMINSVAKEQAIEISKAREDERNKADERYKTMLANLSTGNGLSIEIDDSAPTTTVGNTGNGNGSNGVRRARLSQKSGEYLIDRAHRADQMTIDRNTCIRDYANLKSQTESYRKGILDYYEKYYGQ